MDDEYIEDENLQIIGETDPEELSEDSIIDDKSDVPVRLLSDFTIYDSQTREVLPVGVLTQLKYSSSSYGASGLVKAWTEDGEDEEEVEVFEVDEVDEQLDQIGQRVQLSEILEFDVHHFSERNRTLDRYTFVYLYLCTTRSEFSGPVKFTSEQILHGTSSILHPNYIFLYFLRSGFSTGFCILLYQNLWPILGYRTSPLSSPSKLHRSLQMLLPLPLRFSAGSSQKLMLNRKTLYAHLFLHL